MSLHFLASFIYFYSAHTNKRKSQREKERSLTQHFLHNSTELFKDAYENLRDIDNLMNNLQ